MQTPTIALVAALATTSYPSSDPVTSYVEARRRHGVVSPATPAGLAAFVGDRVIELAAVVTGSIGSSESTTLIVSVDGSPPIFVTAVEAPQWLTENRLRARLLVRATRPVRSAALQASLVAAVAEAELAAREASTQPAPSLGAARSESRRTVSPSRSGRRPRSLPGTIPRDVAPPRVARSAVPVRLAALVPAYTDFVRGQNPRLSAAKAREIAETILAFSAVHGVDARLVVALVLAESTFRPETTSRKGAMGLGQLMPGTAKMLGVQDAYDTEQNLHGTVTLLRRHLDTYIAQTGDTFEGLVLALAAYNAGPGAVKRHGGVPPYRETQNYVRRVVETYRRLTGQ